MAADRSMIGWRSGTTSLTSRCIQSSLQKWRGKRSRRESGGGVPPPPAALSRKLLWTGTGLLSGSGSNGLYRRCVGQRGLLRDPEGAQQVVWPSCPTPNSVLLLRGGPPRYDYHMHALRAC